MKELNALIIGCGAIAREHLLALKAMPGVRAAAVCDLSPARAEATADRYGVPVWSNDYKSTLAKGGFDLVHVTTPPASHFEIARYCLEAGANVLCEKPITPSYGEFKILRDIAERKKVFLLENQNFRYHSSVKKLQGLIDFGEFGEITDVQVSLTLDLYRKGSSLSDANNPHYGAKLRSGVIGDFLPHLTYLATMFAGDVRSFRADWDKRGVSEVVLYDEFRALLHCAQSQALISFSGRGRPDAFWIRISGTKMQAEANLFEAPRIVLRRDRTAPPPLPTLLNSLSESRSVLSGAVRSVARKLGGASSYDGLAAMVENTYHSLRTGAAQPIPLAEVDCTAELVELFSSPERAL